MRPEGGVRLLSSPVHLDEAHHTMSVAKRSKLDIDLLDSAEIKRRNPHLNIDDVLAGLWDGRDGDIDPAQLCQALAARARRAGASILRTPRLAGFCAAVDTPMGKS
nr:FAD-dependent oxidoreductase [Rhodobacter kunshanensis]